jgi:anaerobic ribonucleoside-triphosphate reductase activating protein
MDISNGEGVGVALFVQGCDFHCPSCFNQDTWDFNGGKEWTKETKETFLKLADKPYMKRVSFLGGECLANENLESVYDVIKDVKEIFPDKKIWLWTGYTWGSIFNPIVTDNLNLERDKLIKLRQEIVKMTDILVDGRYIHEQKDMNLKFKGSKNQRVIDVKESIKQGKVIIYCE